MDNDYADYCFIRWTKSYGSGAKEAKFKMKKFHENKSGTFIVDGYPFKRDQLCFLDREFLNLNNEDFEDFALYYVEKFIKYKEEDGELEPVYPKPWMAPGDGNLSEVEQEMLQKTKIKTKKEGNEMTNKITNIASTTVQVNKDAVKLAAKLEVGKIAAQTIGKAVKKQLPMMVRGYADSPFYNIVIANMAGIALREFASNNEKAMIVSEAMIQSAAVEMMSSFNIDEMVNDMLKDIDVSKLTEAKES